MKFDAFISYTHRDNGILATELQTSIQKILKPLFGKPKLKLFRDETDLSASPGLWTVIEKNLGDSRWLMVLLSPDAAQSYWVDREISWWLANRDPERILILLTSGELVWDIELRGFSETSTAIPPVLHKVFQELPLFIDLRSIPPHSHPKGREFALAEVALNLAATLLDCDKRDLVGQEARQRRKYLKWAVSAAVVFSITALIASVSSYVAWNREQQLRKEKDATLEKAKIAASRALSAESYSAISQGLTADVALLLSAAATKVEPTIEAHGALLNSIYLSNFDREFLLHGSTMEEPLIPSGAIEHCTVLAVKKTVNPVVWPTNDPIQMPLGVSAMATQNMLTAIVSGSRLDQLRGKDGLLNIYDCEHHRIVASGSHRDLSYVDMVSIVDFLEGGLIIVATAQTDGIDQKVILWTGFTDDGKVIKYKEWNPKEKWNIAAFGATGARLLASDYTNHGKFYVYKTDTGQKLASFKLASTDSASALALDPSGNIAALGVGGENENPRVILINVMTGNRLQEIPMSTPGQIRSLEFSPTGHMLAVGFGKKAVEMPGMVNTSVLNESQVLLIKINPIKSTLLGVLGSHSGSIAHLSFSVAEDALFSAGMDGKIIKWEIHDNFFSLGTSVAWNDKSRLLVIGDLGGRIEFYTFSNTESDLKIARSTAHDGDVVSAIAISPDSKLVATADLEGNISLWDGLRKNLLAENKVSHSNGIFTLAFSPDSTMLASGGEDMLIKLWHFDEKHRLESIGKAETDNWVTSLAFSPDGHYLASGIGSNVTEGGSLVVWSVPEMTAQTRFVGHSSVISGLAFSPDSSLVASAAGDKKVYLWPWRENGRSASELNGHRGEVRFAAFDASGKVLITCDSTNHIGFWDTRTARLLTMPSFGTSDKERQVDCLGFSKAGDRFQFLHETDGIRSIPFRIEDLYQKACTITGRDFTREEEDRYLSLLDLKEKFCNDAPIKKSSATQTYASTEPQMQHLPGGRFLMGASIHDSDRYPDEEPQVEVEVTPFEIGVMPITRGQFREFVEENHYQMDTGCYLRWNGEHETFLFLASWLDASFFRQQDNYPVVCISWNDAKAYISWLSKKYGGRYRLPSEAEYEYATRAGSLSTRYWRKNDQLACQYANVSDWSANTLVFKTYNDEPCSDGYRFTAPANYGEPNAFGLYGMLGNVWQLIEDCYVESHSGRPTNGIPRVQSDISECKRVMKGGSFYDPPRFLRASNRDVIEQSIRSVFVGFRVARDID